jgi:hypothetical protein
MCVERADTETDTDTQAQLLELYRLRRWSNEVISSNFIFKFRGMNPNRHSSAFVSIRQHA